MRIAFLALATVPTFCQTGQAGKQSTAQINYTSPAIREPAPETSAKTEIDFLKEQVASQQEQITQLRKTLEERMKLIERVLQLQANEAARDLTSQSPRQESAASRTPVALAPDVIATASPQTPGGQAVTAEEPKPSPLSFRIGTAYITRSDSWTSQLWFAARTLEAVSRRISVAFHSATTCIATSMNTASAPRGESRFACVDLNKARG
jgi:hypothetical protein